MKTLGRTSLALALVACGSTGASLDDGAVDAASEAPTSEGDAGDDALPPNVGTDHANALWLRQGIPGNAWPRVLARANDGTIAVSGWFQWGPLAFGDEPPITGTKPDEPAFLVVLEPDGRVRWSRAFDSSIVTTLAFDASGHVWAGGSFRHTVDFGLGPASGPSAEYESDAMLLEYDPDGTCLEANDLHVDDPTSARASAITAIGFDATGDLVVSGALAGAIEIGATTLRYASVPLASGRIPQQFFFASLTPDGSARWTRQLEIDALEVSHVSVALDGGLVFGGFASAGSDTGKGPATAAGGYLTRVHGDGSTSWTISWPAKSGTSRLELVDAGAHADRVVALLAGDPTLLGGAAPAVHDQPYTWARFDGVGGVESIRTFDHGDRATAFGVAPDGVSIAAGIARDPVTLAVRVQLTGLTVDGDVSWRRVTNAGVVGAEWVALTVSHDDFVGWGEIDRPGYLDVGNGLVATTTTTDAVVARMIP